MIIVIVGPTASGKSSLVEKIYPKFNHPLVINADAFQIYQEMNIGTAKIKSSDPLFSSYALLDKKRPDETYSVYQYQKDFRELVNEVLKANRDVIVVGGTGLYIRAALFDYTFLDEPKNFDSSSFNNLKDEELYQKLLDCDPVAAKKIHPNNRKRVIRALNIFNESGRTKSAIIDNQKHELIYDDIRFVFLNPPRDELYLKIGERVDTMFSNGLIEEVSYLLNKYNLSETAKAAIGYKETIDYIQGKTSLHEAKEIIKKRTRNYAKRQITFFKNQFVTTECSSISEAEKLIEIWRNDNDKR